MTYNSSTLKLLFSNVDCMINETMLHLSLSTRIQIRERSRDESKFYATLPSLNESILGLDTHLRQSVIGCNLILDVNIYIQKQSQCAFEKNIIREI